MRQRRKYSDEFKQEAVSLANQSDVPLTQIAEELGITPGILGRWRRELRQHGAPGTANKMKTMFVELQVLQECG